jgi:GNAT superfamily N-acetyltransferase
VGGTGQWSGERPGPYHPVVLIRPLDAETWPTFAEWFASRDSSSDARWCWCMYWRRRSVDFSTSTPAMNREALHALADGELAPGLVALDAEGRAVGWVSLGPRGDFDRLERSRVRPRLDDVPVWAIVCFVVSRRARGTGLQTRLLAAAVEYARDHGAPALEAYPVDSSVGRPSPATLYTGTLSTFLRAGFRVEREVESPGATVARSIVRLDLSVGTTPAP